MSRKKVEKVQSSERELSLLEKIETGGEVIVSLSDVSCPICLCILVEPVEMPCHHVICSPCFQETLTHANISCPVCRTRLSSWARKATKQNNLVNKIIWKYIQEKFPVHVESRLAGEDITDADEILPCIPHHQFADEGEIKSEFEAALTREEQERQNLAKEEEEKSKDLIRKLRDEYELEKKKELDDQQFALLVQNTPSPGKENRFLKKKNIVKGPLDSFLSSSQNMSESQGSQSSLRSPGSSQTMNEGKSNTKGKTLFSTNNIRSFLMENKLQSQSQQPSTSSPLAQRSENLESDSQKEKNIPTSSAQTFDSSLCLELEDSQREDSPLFFTVSTPTILQESQSKESEDQKGEKEKSSADNETEQLKPQEKDASKKEYKKDIECVDDKMLSINEEVEMKGEKSKSTILEDDERDMFENESENLLQNEDDKVDDNHSVKKNEVSTNEDFVKTDDKRDDEPLLRPNRTSLCTVKPSMNDELDEKNEDAPIAGPSGASAIKPSLNVSKSDINSDLNTISSQSLKSFLGISDNDPSFLEEQIQIAKQIEQEKLDMEIALKLQNQLNKEGRSVDRRKGSENGYAFRATTPKSVAASGKKRRRNSSDGKSKKKDKNQMTIKDSFKRTKLSFQESEEL